MRAEARSVPVPGVAQQVYPHACGVFWYYRRVARPSAGPAERILLRFGAVDYFCDVYLDGRRIGSREGAEDPFEFDVTASLRADSLLAVRVVNPGEEPIEGFTCKAIPHRNKFEKMEFRPGWCYNTGGITLPVALEAVPAVRVVDVFVKGDWRRGRVTVETTLRNDSGESRAQKILFTVHADDTPNPVCSATCVRTLPPGETRFAESFDVPGFKLWSVETPNVYTLSVNGFATRFGFRDFRLQNGWFTLNGKRIFLKSAHTGSHLPGGLAVLDAATGYVMVEQRGRRGDRPLDDFSAQPLIYNAEEAGRDAYYWSDHLAAHASTNYYVPFPIRGVLCIEEGLAATNYVFPGDSLVLSGAGNIQWKHFHPTTYTIPNLIALDGAAYWSNEWAKRDPYVQLGRPDLHGRITIGDVPGAPAAFSIQANDHIDNWGYEIWNDIYGEANKTLNLTFNAGSPRSGWFRLLGDHSNFHGSAVVVSNALELGASGFADATVRLERKASVAPCAAAGASVPISNLVVDATSKIVLNPSNGLTVARLMLGAGAAFDVAAGATPLHVTDTLDLQGHAKTP